MEEQDNYYQTSPIGWRTLEVIVSLLTNRDIHHQREDSTVGEIGKSFHRINATIEVCQADHQSTIVEIEGIIYNQNLSILIDPGATLSYITPKMMERFQLAKVRILKP